MPRKRSNGEGNIRKRADGRYEIRISAGVDPKTGKYKKISKYFKTKTEAIQAIHKISEDVKRKEAGERGDYLLINWLDYYIENYLKNTIKQSTYVGYRTYVNKHFLPAFNNLKLKNLSPKMLQEFYNVKYESGLSPKTLRNINMFLHKALQQACRESIIFQNVSECVELPKRKKPDIKILTVEQQKRLILASYKYRYGVFIRLELVTGLRLGELLGLRWADVDLINGSLTVNQTLNRLTKYEPSGENTTEIVFGTPKSENSIRTIPLLNAAVNDLKNWKKVQDKDKELAAGAYNDLGLVVTNELGKFIEPKTFKKYYEKILKDAGIEDMTFHSLRHTFASRSLERKMDSKTLSAILGHYSVAFTLDTYTHVLDEHKNQEIQKLNDLYFDEKEESSNSFVVLVKNNNGNFIVNSVDFEDINLENDDLSEALNTVKEKIREKIFIDCIDVKPKGSEEIVVNDGEFIVILNI